jgi:hypothetical protein
MYGREAPPELLQQLREICPRADLIYWGDGVWMLGRWNPRVRYNPDAAERLDRIVEWPGSDTRHRNITLERMRLRGFARTAEYRFERNEDWGLVREDFRRRIFNLQNRAIKALEEGGLTPDREMGKLVTEDALAEGYDAFRHFLGRTTVTVPQKPWM